MQVTGLPIDSRKSTNPFFGLPLFLCFPLAPFSVQLFGTRQRHAKTCLQQVSKGGEPFAELPVDQDGSPRILFLLPLLEEVVCAANASVELDGLLEGQCV